MKAMGKETLYNGLSVVSSILANNDLRESPEQMNEPIPASSLVVLDLSHEILEKDAPEKYRLFDVIVTFLSRLIVLAAQYLEIYGDVAEEIIWVILESIERPSRAETIRIVMLMRFFKSFNVEEFISIREKEEECLVT